MTSDEQIISILGDISKTLKTLVAQNDVITAAEAQKLLGGISRAALAKGYKIAQVSNGKYSRSEIIRLRDDKSYRRACKAAEAEVERGLARARAKGAIC